MTNSKLENSEKLASIILSLTTCAGIIFGSVFGLIEFTDYKASEKIKNSLVLVERFNGDRLMKARMNVNDVWRKNNSRIRQTLESANFAEGYQVLIKGIVKENNLQQSIEIVMGFFDETAICVDSDICDSKTIQDYFGEGGGSFIRKIRPYLCELRKNWSDPSIWEDAQMYYAPKTKGQECK